jgi:hypothetical protein
MINGAYFDDHVIERATERIGISEFDPKHYEKQIVELEGDIFYDREHHNYQIVFDELAFAFDLKLHHHRPGLLAYVKTTLTNPNEYREDDSRFKKIEVEDYSCCEKCELPAQKIKREC